MAEWYDARRDEVVQFDAPCPDLTVVAGFLGPDGSVVSERRERRPIGFR